MPVRVEGGTATLLPLDLLDGAGLDMIGPEHLRPLRPARRAGPQRRRARAVDAGGAHHAGGLGGGGRRQPGGGLAADPQLRAGAASRARRARRVPDQRAQPRAPRLLGRIRGDQGGARASRPHLGRRGGDHHHAGQPVRPRSGCAAACAPRPSPARTQATCPTRPASLRPSPISAGLPKPATARSSPPRPHRRRNFAGDAADFPWPE